MRRPLPPVEIAFWLMLWLGIVSAAAAQGSGATETGTDLFEDEERLTVLDLPVAGGGRAAEEIRIFLDGVEVPVVARELDEQSPAPWDLVIYFDAHLSSTAALRWGARTLFEQLPGLLPLGTLEILYAEEGGVRSLGSGSDDEALKEALARLGTEAHGDDALATLRRELIEGLQDPDTRDEALALVPLAAAFEAQLARRRMDLLLLTLADRPAVDARRAVFVVSGGHEGSLEDFYGSRWPPRGPQPVGLDQAAEVESFARTLASYGWITFPLMPPPPPPTTVPGLRIGKWRLTGPAKGIAGVAFTREAEREPEKARALVELGRALRSQGRAEEAVEAFEEALHHFYRDPRTAAEQAPAWAELGEILEEQGNPQGARRCFEAAAELDPAYAQAGLALRQAAIDAEPVFHRWAEATSGLVLGAARSLGGESSTRAFDAARENLAGRRRLSFQVSGWPDGALRPLELRGPDPAAMLFPVWARSGTPEVIAEARVRRLLHSAELAEVPLFEAGATFLLQPELAGADSPGTGAVLRLGVAMPSGETLATAPQVLRVTLGLGGPNAEPRWRHFLFPPSSPSTPTSSGGALRSLDLPLPGSPQAEDELLAIVVEDLISGRWQSALLEL